MIKMPNRCRNCEGTNFTWHTHITCINDVPHNRQNANDMACRFVLGCDDCSETLRVLDADDIASAMNAQLQEDTPQ